MGCCVGRTVRTLALTLTLLASAASALAQVTGSLAGTIADNVGMVAGVRVTATEPTTGLSRETVSNQDGLFRLLSLPPGTYIVKVEKDGFKPITVNDVRLSNADIRDLGTLILTAGAVSESITTSASVTPVQTATSSRLQIVTGDTIRSIQMKGRDLFGLMRTLPGVTDANQNRDFTTWTSANDISINGAPSINKSVVIDGFAANEEVGCGTAYVNPNVDAIDEVRIIANGFAAEYGRNNGGLIQISTKSGTNQLRGSAWYNGRRDRFNANDYFRIKNNLEKPLYSVNISGYSVGGPVVLPKVIDSRDSDKRLFFFVSQEFTDDRRPSTVSRTKLPTAPERAGDFSDTRIAAAGPANGSVLQVRDPATGIFFPGSIIPTNRINPIGQAMLNLLPLPNNILSTAPADLYRSNDARDATPVHDRKNFVGRVDIALTASIRASVKWLQDSDNLISPNATAPGLDEVNNYVPGKVVTGSLTQVLSPSMVNDLIVGFGYDRFGYKVERGGGISFDYTSRYQQNIGLFPPRIEPFGAYGQPHLGLDQRDEYPYLPDMLYAGADGAALASYLPSSTVGPLPRLNISERYSVQDDLSLTRGRHNFKFGAYTEYSIKTEPGSSGYTGIYNFGDDQTSASTGYGYANALLGIFTSYSEVSNRVDGSRRHWQTEGYAQDSWRVGSRVTLDYGVRLTHSGAIYETRNQNSGFDPALWRPDQAPRLYFPACAVVVSGSCPTSFRRAVDPNAPGTLLSVALIGNMVPGVGDINNGLIYGGLPGRKPGWYYDLPMLVAAPRVGVAWDVNGDGKSALRASSGVFYNFPRGQYRWVGGPDISITRTITTASFKDVQDAAAAGAGFITTPVTSSVVDPDVKLEKAYNVNVAYQRDLGVSTVAEIAYVGNFGRNGQRNKSINNVPLYAYADPKNVVNGDAVPANILRQPYPGFGAIDMVTSDEHTLNYNAMQVSVERRLSRGLQASLAYTLARGLGMTGWDYYTEQIGGQQALDQRYYGPTATDRRHNFVVTYSYNIPAVPRMPVLKQLASDWQVSGLVQFMSGLAVTPVCNLGSGQSGVANLDPTLSGGPIRCDMTGQAIDDFIVDRSLPEEERLHFNPGAFKRARILPGSTVGNFGNSPTGLLRQPGWWNQDFTLSRRFPVPIGHGGSVRLQFQAYNLFNLVQFTTMSVNQSFNARDENTLAAVGTYLATTNPRQFGMTIRFDY